jgi:hypothetical protein
VEGVAVYFDVYVCSWIEGNQKYLRIFSASDEIRKSELPNTSQNVPLSPKFLSSFIYGVEEELSPLLLQQFIGLFIVPAFYDRR